MSKKTIENYFEIYPGLNLIENPKVSKKNKRWYKSNKKNKTENECQSKPKLNIIEDYKCILKYNLDKLTNTPPITPNFYFNLIETGYYYYLNNNSKMIIQEKENNEILQEVNYLMEFIINNIEYTI